MFSQTETLVCGKFKYHTGKCVLNTTTWPLSEKLKQYLHKRSQDWLIEDNKQLISSPTIWNRGWHTNIKFSCDK